MGRFRLAHTTILTRVTGLGKNIVTLWIFLAWGSFREARPHPMKRFWENRSWGCSGKLDNRCGHISMSGG
jgi:hypothetical protein